MAHKYATINPATGAIVRTFPTMTDDDVQFVLAQADSAYRSWRETPVEARATVLARVADGMREHSEELAALATLEMGKPISQSRDEVALSATIFDYYAQSGPAMLADEDVAFAGDGTAYVRTEPIGAVLGVMPWNFPYLQVVRFAAPTLLVGNSILLKHARSCPQQATRIAEIISASGGPDALYQNIFATSGQIATMVADDRVQGVSLTGSEAAGSAVAAVAGRHIKKCLLELGGSDPFIVLPSADLDAAAESAALNRFRNAGQSCASTKRFIIHESVFDEFLSKFLEKSTEWQLGDPSDAATMMGPMSSLEARADVASQVEDAISKGAVVHIGGKIPEGRGAFYPPTILSGVTESMRAFSEELFGPVAVLYRVSTVDAAIALANNSEFGLGGAVFTGDQREATYVATRLEAGMVGINTAIRSAPDLPFGGVKKSGYGRELGRLGLHEFTNKKLIRTA